MYRLNEEGWTIEGQLPERDLFAIVGADFDDNGDLYLLERKLVMGLWWQSRIRRVRLDGNEDRTLWTSERGDYGNLEGLALWRDGDRLMMTAVSDNNGGDGTPTEFIDFELVPAPPEQVDEGARRVRCAPAPERSQVSATLPKRKSKCPDFPAFLPWPPSWWRPTFLSNSCLVNG